jgi:hypothetical protein
MFQKRLEYFMKKRKKKKEEKEKEKNKRKRTNVPLKIKRDLAAQVSSQSFQVSKRGIHHCHSFTPYNHHYYILYSSVYHHLPYSLYTCIS